MTVTNGKSSQKNGKPVYLLVDGENIDRTLGQILDQRPLPEQRPRWEKIREFAGFAYEREGQQVKALFFINASRGMPSSFVQALRLAKFVPVLLQSQAQVDEENRPIKVVDIAITRTLEALARRQGDVILASHDKDFVPALKRLNDGDRRLGLLGFTEFFAGEWYAEVDGLRYFDIEMDARAFNVRLSSRIRVVDIEQFDPEYFLDAV